MSRHSESEHASMPSEGGQRASLTDSVVPDLNINGRGFVHSPDAGVVSTCYT